MSDITPATNETVENTEDVSIAAELAKSAAISIVTTIGVVAGMAAAGYAVEKFRKFKTRRAEAKAEAAIEEATAE